MIIWQIDGISARRGIASVDFSDKEITFNLLGGGSTTIPGDTHEHTVIVFWRVDSELSQQLLQEAVELFESFPDDKRGLLYLINIPDSEAQIRAALDAGMLALPLGYNPSGSFMDKYEINAIPLSVILTPDGEIRGSTEGYQSGQLHQIYQAAQLLNNNPTRLRTIEF